MEHEECKNCGKTIRFVDDDKRVGWVHVDNDRFACAPINYAEPLPKSEVQG